MDRQCQVRGSGEPHSQNKEFKRVERGFWENQETPMPPASAPDVGSMQYGVVSIISLPKKISIKRHDDSFMNFLRPVQFCYVTIKVLWYTLLSQQQTASTLHYDYGTVMQT